MALLGMDASRHQGTVDWPAVRAASHEFAFLKATDGIQYKYVWWFHNNLPLVRAAGLIPGAYHFLLDHHPGDAQARYYVQEVIRAGGFDGIVPILDVEREVDGTGPRIGTVRAFVNEFRRLVPGRTILIYTGHWYWVAIGNPHGADLGLLWHSEYETTDAEIADGPELDNYGGWSKATFWQYTSSGRCPGVAGSCDLNLFFGSRGDLLALADGTPSEEDWFAMATKEDLAAVLEEHDRNKEIVTNIPGGGYLSPALSWSFIHESGYWGLVNGQDKPTICATNENPTLWFAVWGFKKAGPFTALEADDAVQSDLACYHRSTDPSWRAHMIPQWLMDACELVYEHLPASG